MSHTLNGRAISKSFLPGYLVSDGNSVPLTADDDGVQQTRGLVLTDEGGYRANFTNTSLAISIGSCTFTYNSDTVTTAGSFSTVDVHTGDYIYLIADGVTFGRMVSELYDKLIVLESPYQGTGGTGASSRQIVISRVGTGGTIAVASGACTIASGTTTASISEVERDVDYFPLKKITGFTVSQRIANQDWYLGFYSEAMAPTNVLAWFHFTGTDNTIVKTETGRNPTSAPSAAETESYTVKIPNGSTTATAHRYDVELLKDRCNFYIDQILVATHFKSLPQAHDILTSTCQVVNGTSPASTTTGTLDYDACLNFNTVTVDYSAQNTQSIAPNVPSAETAYNVSGVITINTDLMILDCTQLRQLIVSCISMGTSGVVTPAFSNDDGTTWFTPTYYTLAGVAVTSTFNAAGNWTIPVAGKLFRLRLTTATTAGATTLRTEGYQQEPIKLVMGTVQATCTGTVTANLGTGGTGATSLGKAEDAVAASGDTLVGICGVRTDALVTGTSATNDYGAISLDRFGSQLIRTFEKSAKTYRASSAISPVSAANKEFIEIYGNATTTVVVTSIKVTGCATAAVQWLVSAVKRSAAATGGTKTAMNAVPLDSTDSAASSIPQYYTVDATSVGSAVGVVSLKYIPLAAGLASATRSDVDYSFGDKGKGILLSGIAQGLTLASIGAVPAGIIIAVEIEWYEF